MKSSLPESERDDLTIISWVNDYLLVRFLPIAKGMTIKKQVINT